MSYFHSPLRITHEPLNISKIWLFHMKEHHKTYQKYYRLYLKNNFYKVKIYFSGQIDLFSVDFFFWKPGQGDISMTDSSNLSSVINYLIRNEHFLSHGCCVLKNCIWTSMPEHSSTEPCDEFCYIVFSHSHTLNFSIIYSHISIYLFIHCSRLKPQNW